MSPLRDYFVNAQTILLIGAILAWGWLTFFNDKLFPKFTAPQAEISHQVFATCLDN